MLVACIAAARVLFRKNDRIWAALVMPALIVALAATLSRNALGRRVRRHRPAVPDARLPAGRAAAGRRRAAFIAFAPAQMTDRLYSSFRLKQLRHDTATTRPACSRTTTGWR